MSEKSIKELRRKAAMLKPGMTIGKGQVSGGVLAELDRMLEAGEIVKLKFLRTSDPAQREGMVSRLVEETRSRIVETRGNTITLYRARGSKQKRYIN